MNRRAADSLSRAQSFAQTRRRKPSIDRDWRGGAGWFTRVLKSDIQNGNYRKWNPNLYGLRSETYERYLCQCWIMIVIKRQSHGLRGPVSELYHGKIFLIISSNRKKFQSNLGALLAFPTQ